MPTKYTETLLSFSERARPRALRSGAVDMESFVVRGPETQPPVWYLGFRRSSRAGANASDKYGAARSTAHAALNMLHALPPEILGVSSRRVLRGLTPALDTVKLPTTTFDNDGRKFPAGLQKRIIDQPCRGQHSVFPRPSVRLFCCVFLPFHVRI